MKSNITLQKIVEAYQKKYNLDNDVEKITSLQLKIIEDDIMRKAKVPISESTLRRIFQQKTENPQLATLNALCICLGYNSYTDFISEIQQNDTELSTSKEEKPTNNHLTKRSSALIFFSKKKLLYFIGIVISLIILAIILRPLFEKYQLSRVVFESDSYSGTPPTTFHIHYYIPWGLNGDDFTIEYIDADGKIVGPNKIDVKLNSINKSFFQIKENRIVLKYKNEKIKELKFFIRNPGWTIFNPEAGHISQTEEYRKNGIFHLVPDSALLKHLADKHAFIEYEYYDKNTLGDGDGFTLIARLRNSDMDSGTPYYDINADVTCERGNHGIIFNNGASSYMRILSSDKEITGETYDFSHLSYTPENWQLVKINVKNKITEFFVNDNLIYSTQYQNPVGKISSLMFRFKGVGSIDYVRLYDDKGSLIFEDDF